MKLKQALMSLILVGGLLALTLSYADQTKEKAHRGYYRSPSQAFTHF